MGIKVLGNLTIGTVNQYIEQQNNYFNVAADEEQTCEVEEVTEAEETTVDDCKAEADEALLAVLTVFFRGNEEEARRFLHTISGKKPTFVIGKVNELVRAGKIGQEFKGRPLWKALHNAGLYKPTETNWNSQIK